MQETRNWEQMRADNDGSAWINEDGEFCREYVRTPSDEDVENILSAYTVPEWAKPGFNGCWSCDRMVTCPKVRSYQESGVI